MSNICGDNRWELIEKYKKKIINATNINSSPKEMEVLDNILFRMWQMGWLDKLENNHEKELKALEIIKKEFNFNKCPNLKKYIGKEKYDLLKEVLRNE